MTLAIEPLKVSDPFNLARKKSGSLLAHPKSSYTVDGWDRLLKSYGGYLRINGHGGGCCGMKHMNNFPVYDIMWEFEIARLLEEHAKKCPGQVIEAVLNGTQANTNDYAWVKCLLKNGFRLVSSNVNSNSSNDNYVFHLVTRPVRIDRNPTYKKILELQGKVVKNVDA